MVKGRYKPPDYSLAEDWKAQRLSKAKTDTKSFFGRISLRVPCLTEICKSKKDGTNGDDEQSLWETSQWQEQYRWAGIDGTDVSTTDW